MGNTIPILTFDMDKDLALKASVIVLTNIYPDDFEEKFGYEKLKQIHEDTEELAGKDLSIEEILYNAIYNKQ